MMTSQAYRTKNTWYVAYEVTGSPDQKKYAVEVIQIPAVCGTAKSTNHKSNVLDLIKQMYPKATTLADIGITKTREVKGCLLEVMLLQAIAQSYSVPDGRGAGNGSFRTDGRGAGNGSFRTTRPKTF
jgi:hypothetical protein